MKILKPIVSTLFITFAVFLSSPLSLGTGGVANADTKTQINQGINDANGGTQTLTPEKTISTTITNVINIASAVVGIVAVIMIIVAGLRYTTSGGNPEAAKGAKNTILYAIIGLVIVALAQVIVHFVLHQTSS